jgi:hypothetical protein
MLNGARDFHLELNRPVFEGGDRFSDSSLRHAWGASSMRDSGERNHQKI